MVNPKPADAAYYTTYGPTLVILIGCLLMLIGIVVPWSGAPTLALDLTKAGIHDAPLFLYSFLASTLGLASFVLLFRLHWPAPIFTILVSLLLTIVVGAIRSHLQDPGLGLYLLPLGAGLVVIGSFMALAYPPQSRKAKLSAENSPPSAA